MVFDICTGGNIPWLALHVLLMKVNIIESARLHVASYTMRAMLHEMRIHITISIVHTLTDS